MVTTDRVKKMDTIGFNENFCPSVNFFKCLDRRFTVSEDAGNVLIKLKRNTDEICHRNLNFFKCSEKSINKTCW